jgi:hypothetical protein
MLESKEIYRERERIDRLLASYEASSDFEGWFPNWLWEGMHKNNHRKYVINYGNTSRVVGLREKLSEWTIENFAQSLRLH